MKSILLATASILAFAGAAAAEVTFGGDAKLGFNIGNGDEGRDSDDPEASEGFFWEANLGVTLSQELNNGLTAAASFTLNIADTDNGGDVDVDNDFLLSLTAESGGLFLGDTAFAPESHWDPAGNMFADDFSEQDGEVVLRGDFTYAGIEASVSGVLADAGDDPNTPDDDLDQLAFGAETTIGRFNMSLGYQEESEALDGSVGDYDPVTENDDFDVSEVFGISVGTTFGGADVGVAYAKNFTFEDDSLGFEVSYPFGPVTLGAYYVIENDDASDIAGDLGNEDLENSFGVSADYASGPLTVSAFYEFEDDGNEIDDPVTGDFDFDNDGDDQDEDDDYGIEIGYDVGNGLELYAGLIDETGNYVGAEYDLGNGAQLIASYADQDEEGAREYEAGTTLQAKFSF
ncbi:putative porin [Rubellimicrobium mesophilum DSM 19309]|uniref:Putative porin n=1 Tax=Rubellimicrobium mesophilum DSM 19309 TaxID=442562 RepID=A0A017HJL7_9RHOB|nr:porin [Rubellimicrobium mesophilum]EYD74692.1 putative porin [Rubellimicrobium mesophilum DSM 19309]